MSESVAIGMETKQYRCWKLMSLCFLFLIIGISCSCVSNSLSPCWNTTNKIHVILPLLTGSLITDNLLPARRYASTGLCDSNVSVRPSVRHAPVLCQKWRKLASWFLHHLVHSPTILVFWRQISSQNSKGSPRAGASNEGGVGKISSFLSLSVNISKKVAATAKVTIND